MGLNAATLPGHLLSTSAALVIRADTPCKALNTGDGILQQPACCVPVTAGRCFHKTTLSCVSRLWKTSSSSSPLPPPTPPQPVHSRSARHHTRLQSFGAIFFFPSRWKLVGPPVAYVCFALLGVNVEGNKNCFFSVSLSLHQYPDR